MAVLVPVLVQAEDETFLPYQQSGVNAANTNCEAFAAPGEPSVISVLCTIEEGYEPFEMVCGPDKTLYVVAFRGDRGLLTAIAPNGAEKWKREVPFPTWAPAIESCGDVYVAAGDSVYRIDPSGRNRWIYRDNKSRYEGISLIPGHGLLTWGSWGSLAVFDPKGTKKWSRPGIYSRPVPCAPEEIACLGDDEKGVGLYVCSTAGSVVRYFFGSRPIDVSFAGVGYLVVELGRMRMVSLDGQSVWRWRYMDGIQRSPALAPNGNIYIYDNDEDELVCHGLDGREKWKTRYQVGSNVRPLAFADSRVLTCSAPEYGPLRVSLIDMNGASVWRKALPTSGTGIPANTLAAFSDGTIFVGLKNGSIYALKQH